MILCNADNLKERLDSVKKMTENKNYNILEIKDMLRDELDSLSNNIYQPLPKLPAHGFTQLDKLMREHRAQDLAILREECDILREKVNSSPLSDILAEIEEYIARLKRMAIEVIGTIIGF